MMRPQPLLDVLGGRWSLGVPVIAAAWDDDLAGFALGDGSVAVTRAEWDGGPRIAPRRGGGLELHPGTPPPPLARQTIQSEGCLALRANPAHGFLTGGRDASLSLVTPDLSSRGLSAADGQAEHFAIGADGMCHATAIHQSVTVTGPAAVTFEVPAPVVALSFNEGGQRLAVADEIGVTLWTADEAINRLETPGRPVGLAWSADGARLACSLDGGAVEVWDFSEVGTIYYVTLAGQGGAATSLSFAPDGGRIAVGGDRRVLCWSLDPPSDAPAPCGLLARAPITQVAWHPSRALIAAGTAHGAVTLAEPGSQDALHLRDEGGGAVTALAWSLDGSRLAIGTAEGDLGVLPLPDVLFRRGGEEAPQ